MAVEPSTYLGFPFAISDRDVTIGHPETGRTLAAVSSVPKARAFVRGWRREERRERNTTGLRGHSEGANPAGQRRTG